MVLKAKIVIWDKYDNLYLKVFEKHGGVGEEFNEQLTMNNEQLK